jgi:hypothetical protein
VTAVLFAIGNFFGRRVVAPSWPMWIIGVGLTVALCAALALALGPTPETRRKLVRRIRNMATGVRSRGPVA